MVLVECLPAFLFATQFYEIGFAMVGNRSGFVYFDTFLDMRRKVIEQKILSASHCCDNNSLLPVSRTVLG